MNTYQEDRKILRELAYRYSEIAFNDDNFKKMAHHRDVNDIKSKVPILLIDEIPWEEMNIDDELTIRCENENAKAAEAFFREKLYRAKHIPCDTIYHTFFPVTKRFSTSGIGIEKMNNSNEEDALSHTFVNQIKDEDDLEKLHNEIITYDEEGSLKDLEFFGSMFGDILPVKLFGAETGYTYGLKTMDDVVWLRGLDTFFFDFIDRPEFMHSLIGKLTDIFVDKMHQLEALDLLEGNALYCHSTSALSNDLPAPKEKVKLENVWGRGLAQIFASVSPEMQDEFDTQYMIKALSEYKLVYYGCCEPLDKKIDLIAKIPNLRKISITPWADVENACSQIEDRYVVASKTNPALLAFDSFDEYAVRNEILSIATSLKNHNCSADIVLKDITTVRGKPENLFKWHDIAMHTLNDVFS